MNILSERKDPQLETKIFYGLKSIIKIENKTNYTNFFVPISPKYQGP